MSVQETRPRIAILASYPVWLLEDSPIPSFQGHYATWLPALAETFQHHDDFEVHWVTLSKATRKPIHLERMGQHFHILPRTSRTIGLYTFYLYDRFTVARELRRIAPDLVHAWGNEDCYGLCSRDFQGKKLISTQGMLKAYAERAPMTRFFRHQAFYETFVYRSHPWVTAESPWSRERVEELTSTAQIFALEYATGKNFLSKKRKLTIKPTCLFAGSDTPIKNVDLLIDVFSRPELSHIELRLAGVNPGSRIGLPFNIRPLGRLSRDQIVEQLSEVWCLVHPSLADASPNIVKEARVMGVPVILSKECGNNHYIIEGRSGFVCDARDADAFVRSILIVTCDAETSLRMGSFGVDECRHALSEETMYNNLRGIYHTILNS